MNCIFSRAMKITKVNNHRTNLMIWLLLTKQRKMWLKSTMIKSFCCPSGQEQWRKQWRLPNIYRIFLVNCFVSVIAKIWPTVNSLTMIQITTDWTEKKMQLIKGKLQSKRVKLIWKSMISVKKWAITDFNAPDGSQDIPFWSQEFEQDERHRFVGFEPHFHLNMTSQTRQWNIESVISQGSLVRFVWNFAGC